MSDEYVQLTADLNSHCKGLRQYGAKGEIVKVIGIYGSVLIVENTKKNRFPVRKEKTCPISW